MNECDLYDCINFRWLYDCIIAYDRWTRWNETKQVRCEADWHRSTNTQQTSLEMMLLWINRATDGVNPVQSTDRCLVGIKPIVDQKSGRSRHLWAKSLEEIAICRPTQSVHPLARLSSHALCFIFLKKSLTFAWTTLSGFQSTGSIFLFYAPNFCLDRPFGFSVHRDALYCLSRLFRFSI